MIIDNSNMSQIAKDAGQQLPTYGLAHFICDMLSGAYPMNNDNREQFRNLQLAVLSEAEAHIRRS